MRRLVSLGILIAIACTPAEPRETPTPPLLRPYRTATALATTPPLGGLIVTAPAPLPSPTPFLYRVVSGDTLSQIAEKFHVSLDALVGENPDLNPNAMSVGQVLRIPGNPASHAGQATATPEPLAVTQMACHPTADGGLWCFALLHNDSPNVVENVTAQVTLISPGGQVVGSKPATLPLDVLPPGQSLPLAVFFPPGVEGEAVPQLQMLTAMRLLADDPRYLPASVRDTLARVSWSGLTAELSGEVYLLDDSATAKSVWVAAVAYDQNGTVVGVRRWESNSNLNAGAGLPFSFMISALSGGIERVEYIVEARP